MVYGKRGGWVYFGESTRSDGSKKVYTGITRRPVSERWGEHITGVRRGRRQSHE